MSKVGVFHRLSPPHAGELIYLERFLSGRQNDDLVSFLDQVPRNAAETNSYTEFSFIRPVYDGSPIDSREEACAGSPVADAEGRPAFGAQLPGPLLELSRKVTTTLFEAGLDPTVGADELTFTSVYADRYPPGGFFVPHTDRQWYGPLVAGVSAGGGSCSLTFSSGDGGESFTVRLAPGSMYAFYGAVRRPPWVHAIHEVTGVRYGVTFRTAASTEP